MIKLCVETAGEYGDDRYGVVHAADCGDVETPEALTILGDAPDAETLAQWVQNGWTNVTGKDGPPPVAGCAGELLR